MPCVAPGGIQKEGSDSDPDLPQAVLLDTRQQTGSVQVKADLRQGGTWPPTQLPATNCLKVFLSPVVVPVGSEFECVLKFSYMFKISFKKNPTKIMLSMS